jgi:hypothetical protein
MDLRWQCKAKDDRAGTIIAKFFGTNLYGKFAANPDNYENHMIVPMDIIAGLPDAGWQFGGEIGPWALAKQPLQDARKRFYNVATGASITGYVRAMLWRAICSSKGVAYCDTDAITCEEPGEFVTMGDALGQWKHEGNFDRLGIAGKKLYIMRGAFGWWKTADGKIVQALKKPTDAERLYATASKGAKLTHAQLWRVAADGEVDYESESPTFSVSTGQSFVKRRIRKTAK